MLNASFLKRKGIAVRFFKTSLRSENRKSKSVLAKSIQKR